MDHYNENDSNNNNNNNDFKIGSQVNPTVIPERNYEKMMASNIVTPDSDRSYV